ncbi:MAG: hemolysin family protein [Anaerolineae bacterium]|nr:hemolysin family protein [Anaerolineae bacterium]MCX8067564.1 hemolysin family protein [Anaerolineae bacterium]MDW7991397.1 hemolysin family protein [Anaerolineae bacterium]
MNVLMGLLGVFFFVALNAFFAAAEFGLASVRRTRVEELASAGHTAAILLRQSLEDPERFVAATQLGVTIASLALGWIGEPALAHLFLPLFQIIPGRWAEAAAHSAAAALAFALITFLHIVAGELLPKSVVLQNPERAALLVARPMRVALALFRPAIWVLNGAGNGLLRLLRIRPVSGQERVHSIAELRMLIEASRQGGVLREEEGEMLQAVFDLRAARASRVMVPRTEMVCVPAEATVEEVADLAERTGHTKFPVFEGDLDQIVGVVYLQDLIRPLRQGKGDMSVRALVREALFLPETVLVADLLAHFRQTRQHLAILVDEYGGTAGLVTLDDLLEEIVGDVGDIFEQASPQVQHLPDGSVLVDGLLTIDEVNEALGLHLHDPYYETIGGLVMGRLDRVPVVGDEVMLEGGIRLRVEEMDGLRVARVRIIR